MNNNLFNVNNEKKEFLFGTSNMGANSGMEMSPQMKGRSIFNNNVPTQTNSLFSMGNSGNTGVSLFGTQINNNSNTLFNNSNSVFGSGTGSLFGNQNYGFGSNNNKPFSIGFSMGKK